MIRLSNVYYMLAYAYQSLNEKALKELDSEAFEHIHDLFAAILARGASALVRRGIGRDYQTVEETTSAPCGKIDISSSVRRNTLMRKELCCRHDEYSVDTQANRALKAAMQVLLIQGVVQIKNRVSLKRLLGFFAGVRDVHPRDIHWDSLRAGRVDGLYRLLLGICELVIKGMLMIDREGNTCLREYMDDQKMHRLYEKFLLNYYRMHFPNLAPAVRYLEWDVQYATDESLLPTMKTDITLRHMNRMLIIDAKWYGHNMQYNAAYNKRSIISGNLYQIYAYVQNATVSHNEEVSGMLLYARTDDPFTPDGDFVISGNAIFVRSLDLSLSWLDIRCQLDAIAMRVLAGM